MAKHFVLDMRDGYLSFRRDDEKIAAEATLDGIYVIRTSVPKDRLSAEAAVGAYKSLAQSLSPCRRGWNGLSGR